MFLWIWNIKNLGTPQQVADKIKSLGINDVCLKYHDGSSPGTFKNDFLQYAPYLKQAGIRVGAWGYNYFNNLEGEIALINEAVKAGDYYIFDGETELEGKQSQADYVAGRVRQANLNALLGYSSFPYISYHSSFPYEEFDKYCNFASPQCYWETIGTSAKNCLDRALTEYRNRGLKLPFYPSIQGYKQPESDYSVLDAYSFNNLGVWVLDSLDNNCIAYLERSRAANPPVTPPSPPPPPKNDSGVLQLQRNLNTLKIRDSNENVLAEDGLMGPKTRSAIVRLQNILALSPDGIAGPITNHAISLILSKPMLQAGSTGIPVRYLQWRLNVSVDGIFGPQTKKAVQTFQSNHYLASDGIVGPLTWGALLS